MKKILFAFSMMFAMVACSFEDVTMPQQVPTDGTTLINFSVQVPDMQEATRTMASQEITKLDLVVFDEQGYLVEVAQAKVNGNASWSDEDTPANPAAEQKYSVELLQSAAPRIIHFIANSPVAVDSYSYGSERELINALETFGSADAYWQRKELSSILGDQVVTTENNETKVVATADSELAKELNQIPLVRNFAKVTVNDEAVKSVFTDVKIAVFNAPQRGKVAPYNTNAGTWADYTTVPSYTTLTTAKYYGYEAANLGGQNNDFADTGFADVQYLYEYNMDGKNITAGTKYPFVIIEGSYQGRAKSYYKVDLVDADGNYYNILRNFNYNIIINSVSGDGYSSADAAAAAAASNNISASIDTRNLLNISDGESRLYVEYTTKYITSDDDVTLKYKFVPNIGSPNTVDNDYVLTGTPTTDNPVDLTEFVAGDVINSFEVADSDVDGWRTITIKPKNTTGTKQQAVTISASTLSRTVTYYSVSAYQLGIDCPAEVPASVGAPMKATLTIPEYLPEAIFPLEFVIVSDKLSISPDATKENMPVKTNLKADGTEGGQYFGFVKTLEYDKYVLRGADGNITGYNTSIDCYFKTSIAASASTVSAYNPYFNPASDSFTNSKATYDRALTVSLSDEASYYGEGHVVTVTIDAPESTAAMTLAVTLEGLQDTRASLKTTYIGNGQHTLTFYTSDWNTTRKVTVSGLTVETDTAKITYTDGEASATVNTLYIAAGNIKWNSFYNKKANVYLLRVQGDKEIDIIATGSTSNSESKLMIEDLKDADMLYLRCYNGDSKDRRYSTTAMSAKSVVAGSGPTYTWTKDTTKPSY